MHAKRGYTTPPYSAAIVAEKITEADRLFAEGLAELEQEIVRGANVDDWRDTKWTLWGLLAIALSTVLQGIAALIS